VKRRARIDTGSPNDFISYKTVVRLCAEKNIEPLPAEEPWYTLQGEEVRAKGKLHLEWACGNGNKTRDTDFYVVDTEYFDVLLGRSFCEKSKAVQVDRSLLPLYKNKRSKGMLHIYFFEIGGLA
jgi:hypothetical protein